MKARNVSVLLLITLSAGIALGRSSAAVPHVLASHPPAASPYARFVGHWFHHGGGLVVHGNGAAFYSYRTYVFCTAQLTTTCDKQVGNTIFDGGFSTITLHRVAGDKAFGSMDNSAYSWQVGTSVTLVLSPNDTLMLREAGTAATILCGPHAPAEVCGA